MGVGPQNALTLSADARATDNSVLWAATDSESVQVFTLLGPTGRGARFDNRRALAAPLLNLLKTNCAY
jgi:hypothetical protein